ncbi:MAG: SDR family NAD(P)-dependent oxidoreductase [candidate division WOR-3 bacterium]
MIRNNRLDPKTCSDNFENKLVVITGATSGIGYFTAVKYASHGANLCCVNRNEEKSRVLRDEIENKYKVKCDCIIADLSRLNEIRRVGEILLNSDIHIDVLIHNAGIYLTHRQITEDGIEKVFVVNYLSSFMLNFILKDKLKKQGKARIIIVNSEGHRFVIWGLRLDDLNWEKRRYSGLRSYGYAKTAQLLSMLIFNEYFKDSGVTINGMHPGAVRTETGKENGPVYRWIKENIYDKMLKSPEISAEALYYLGVAKDMDGISGKFFNLTTEENPAPPARDREVAWELWEKSLKLSGLGN